MSIYVASRPKHAPMWRRLRDAGVEVTSSWIDLPDGPLRDPGSAWVSFISDIAASDSLVVYLPAEDLPVWGVIAEAGAALALGKSVYILAVGDVDLRKSLGSWTLHPGVITTTAPPESAGAALEALVGLRRGR